ncbi:potassium transporter 5-like [Olea europaea subsp. europaea]|uniref:Potassium transporter 5-like n=1 Tax=Olea europaea subsp. europaea TaxID=158383 RepID=A0A8S0VFC5_OLEEU|nr:potassium transporter 5-like [Olea europaea subsp. europaea]
MSSPKHDTGEEIPQLQDRKPKLRRKDSLDVESGKLEGCAGRYNHHSKIRPELDWGDDGEFSDEEIEGENRGDDGDGDNGDGDVEVNGERQGRENSIEAIGSTSEVSGNEGREVGHFEGSTVEGRERRPPYWVEDYVSGEGLSEDEEAVYMVQDAGGDWSMILHLAFQSIGVAFGDLGTSPLYVYPSAFADGGTFALYSSLCRHAKVTLIPNQEAEDRDVSTFQLELPNNGMRRAPRIKTILENSRFAKYVLLFATMLGTSMVIGDGVLAPCVSGQLRVLSKAASSS